MAPTRQFTDDFLKTQYNAPAGGYKAKDFVSEKPEVAIVAGKFMGEKAEFIFSSTRVVRDKKGLFYEQLTIQSAVGDLFATALYEDDVDDELDAILSTATDADYVVVAANGCFDDLEGDNINITFDNKSDGRPRTIVRKPGKGDRCKEVEKKDVVATLTSASVFTKILNKLLDC